MNMNRHTTIQMRQNNRGEITAEINGDMSIPNVLLGFSILQQKLIKGEFFSDGKGTLKGFAARQIDDELGKT